jgi:hypothetical protein
LEHSQPNKTAVIVVSDAHINGTTALSPKVVPLDDGGTYHANKLQRALWETWIQFVADVDRMTAGMRRIVVMNGDMIELDTKRRSIQLITLNKAQISRIVIDTLEPILDIADNVIVTRGTAAHVGKSAWSEELLANDLDNTIRESEHAASFWHFRGIVAGVKFDIAHHGRMGSNVRTSKNAANLLAFDTMSNYLSMEAPAPDVVIRSHNHRRSDSGRNYKTFAMFTPAWTFLTEFGYRIGAENSIADIGGDIFICDNGEYTWTPLTYAPKVSRVWALKI